MLVFIPPCFISNLAEKWQLNLNSIDLKAGLNKAFCSFFAPLFSPRLICGVNDIMESLVMEPQSEDGCQMPSDRQEIDGSPFSEW